jgi:hypothetical protein
MPFLVEMGVKFKTVKLKYWFFTYQTKYGNASIYKISILIDSAFSNYTATSYLSLFRCLTSSNVLSAFFSTLFSAFLNYYSALGLMKTVFSLNWR